jgi:tyrosyl-tRNA synthetase
MSNNMTLSEELTWRGLVNQTTYANITAIDGEPIKFYWGVDPSSDSMTIGNLAAAMMVRHFVDRGHQAILLVGEATGLIGDPDGKAAERPPKSSEEIAKNTTKIVEQCRTLFAGRPFNIVNNNDWFKDIKYVDFLRDVGTRVPVNQMLGREFVKSRLGEDGSGIKYAEFSYALMQAYDFLHLHREQGVDLQVCGADQWGNSIAGVDLIRRVTGDEAQVFSVPLIIDKATGQKFGKSEEGAIWLDANKTSVYRFYQFWLNVDDESVEGYLKVFTELDKPAIEQTMTAFDEHKGGRHAQRTLAYEVTKLVHGPDQADKQVRIAEAIAKQDLAGLSDAEIATLREEIPVARTTESSSITDVLLSSGLAGSKTEAQRLLNDNAVTVNGRKTNRGHFEPTDFQNGRLLLRRGKAFKDSALVELG